METAFTEIDALLRTATPNIRGGIGSVLFFFNQKMVYGVESQELNLHVNSVIFVTSTNLGIGFEITTREVSCFWCTVTRLYVVAGMFHVVLPAINAKRR